MSDKTNYKCPKCGSTNIESSFAEKEETVTSYGFARFSCDLVGNTVGLFSKAIPIVNNHPRSADYIGQSISGGLKYIFGIDRDKTRIVSVKKCKCQKCKNEWEMIDNDDTEK